MRVLPPQAKRVQKEEETRTDWLQGQFLPMGRIAHLEGGGALGWRNVTGVSNRSRK